MKQNIDLHISFAHTMDTKSTNIIIEYIQWLLILVTNLFFVCKYIPRAGIQPFIGAIAYCIAFGGIVYIFRYKIKKRITETFAKWATIALCAIIIAFIAGSIFLISPYSIQVDRWSATTFFLDALFNGIYPYGVHTHVCDTNFPSPFPLWHYMNIPFWLIGDVGWIQVFFLVVFLISVYYYFRTWQSVLYVLLILCISPAYWWELVTRSDGLSNALGVSSCILFIERFPIKMEKKWWQLAIISGCIASTRLSAIIPIALYLFRPWIDANWNVKVGFIAIALSIAIFFFAPYIFWDTETWIFFQRNPFMSQTTPGSLWILGIMIIIALLIAYRKQTFYYYNSTTSIFMFAFMLFTQLGVIWRSTEPVTLFDACCDISYFTLALPYAIIALNVQTNEHK